MTDLVTTSMMLPAGDRAALKALAAERGMTMGAAIRLAVARLLAESHNDPAEGPGRSGRCSDAPSGRADDDLARRS